MLSDDKLIDQIKYGNERAAEELITRYYASILRYCRWHCSSVEKAEDLTQETFYKLFKNISGYKGKRKFNENQLSPKVRKLRGIIKSENNKDYKDILTEELSKKYGI